MPAFDPVRDAVLNSPITQSHPLSPYPRLDLQSPNSFPNHNSALPSPIVSPSLGRRATDLSVLLNSDSQEPSHRTPRSSNLSHLLRSSTEDKLATAEPLRRSMNLNVEINHEKHEGSLSFSRRLSSPPSKPSFSDLGLPTKSPVPGPSSARLPPPDSNISPSPSFSFTSLSAFPTPPSHFAATSRRTRSPALPLPQTIPYNPRNRITPAGSVLIPMSQEEMERYKDYCGVGTARLTKRKRGRSDEPDVRDEPASKKLVGDAGVVVEHCGFPSRLITGRDHQLFCFY
jgi:mRNA (guanine-N7-)-methyltransferase